MPDIEFTQYIRPHGLRRKVRIERPEAIADKARQITDAGYHLEAEILGNSALSLTIADRIDEIDVDIEICPAEGSVPAAIDRLIMRFDPSVPAGEHDLGEPLDG